MAGLAEWSLYFYRLPYLHPVSWAHEKEIAGVYSLLVLVDDDGFCGVAEATLKPTWSGLSPMGLKEILSRTLIPALNGIDLSDAISVSRMLSLSDVNPTALGLIDTACLTLAACRADTPLWKSWNGKKEVDMCWTVLRQDPELMVRDAVNAVSVFGMSRLKIKTGQSIEIDHNALRGIRNAVGPEIALYCDANESYSTADVDAYLEMIANEGACLAEDPCKLLPNDEFSKLQARSPLPLLVDSRCYSEKDAIAFLEHGARALSVKPARVGLNTAKRIADLAKEHDADVTVGMYAESQLGTMISGQLASALVGEEQTAAAELGFYLGLKDQITVNVMIPEKGKLVLPDTANWRDLIDWERVSHFGLPPI